MVADDCWPAKPADRPRRKIAPWPGPLFEKVTFGVYLSSPSIEVTFSLLSVSVLNACSVIGTSWID